MAQTIAGKSLKGVDPRLADTMQKAAKAFEQQNPGYKVSVISGLAGRKSGTKQHPAGEAVDVKITAPDGTDLGNYRNAKTFRTYEKFAQLARTYQTQFHPELDGTFRWGGYFGGRYAFDQMHFDVSSKWKGAMSQGTWAQGLNRNKAGQPVLRGAESVGLANQNIGAGPWGAPEQAPGYAAHAAAEYGLAGNRRAYEQGVRPPSSTPVFTPPTPQQIEGYQTLGSTLASQGLRGLGGAPMPAPAAPPGRIDRPSMAGGPATFADMLSGMSSPVYGPGQTVPAPKAVAPSADVGASLRSGVGAVAPASAAPAGQSYLDQIQGLSQMKPASSPMIDTPSGLTGPLASPAPASPFGKLASPQSASVPTLSPNERVADAFNQQVDVRANAPAPSLVDTMPMASGMPSGPLMGPEATATFGLGTPISPTLSGDTYATATGPVTPSLAELSTMRDRPAPPALPQYNVSTAAPAFNTPPAAVADKVQPPAIGGQPVTDTVQREVAAPVIGQPAPGIIGGSFPPAPTPADMAANRAKGMVTNPMASMSQGLLGGLFQNPKASLGGALGGFMIGGLPGALLGGLAPSLGLGNPLKGLGSLFGGMPSAPNPTKTNYGTGLKAISAVLGGAGGPGATAYSRSTPGYSVTNLGNGYVAKTNQYGKTSYEFTGFPSTMKDSGWFGGKSSSSGFSGFGSGRTASKSEASKYSGKAGLY